MKSRLVPALVVLLAATAGLTSAQPAARAVATLSASPSELYFRPLVSADRWSLTVVGPNDFVRTLESAGGPPSISLFDPRGSSLPDGSYRYELRALPAPARKRQGPEAAEPSSDGAPVDALGRQGRTEGPSADTRARDLPVLSGSFTILGGALVAPGAAEEPRSAGGRRQTGNARVGAPDQVIPDDLIVQSSLCVGLDCVDGESFGFDTIRLKENNLRLAFDDTSVAPFPANDWALVANDTLSGGPSKFSIEDVTGALTPFTILAAAPTDSLFVASTGKVGLRTSTPTLDLHLNTGDTPGIRLEQNAGGGFTAQTWDVAGNEANFFVRDVTGGSRLPLRIRPGAPTSSLDIAASGNVGMGIAGPATSLHVKSVSGTAATFRLENSSGIIKTWDIKNNIDTGRLTITDDPTSTRVPFKLGTGAANNLLRVGAVATNQVDINGNLVVTGTITPDYVFDPAYRLESIEEHAEFMWEKRHLPALAPAQTTADGKGVIDVGARSQGLLEEVEKAHIYIEQLNQRLRELSLGLERKDAALAELRREVEALKQPRTE